MIINGKSVNPKFMKQADSPFKPGFAAEAIKIFIVDDNSFIRKMFKQLIEMEGDCRVTGEADNSYDALKSVAQNDYDVVLLDISLESEDRGVELIREIRSLGRATPILVISLYEQSLYLERIRTAGAQGYLMKQNATDFILPAIRQLFAGQVYWTLAS